MKRIHYLLIAVIAITLFSCKKEDNNAVTMPGTWVGWWSAGSSSTHNNMTTVFRSDGTVRVLYGYVSDTTIAVYKSEGTYTVNGNTLKFQYNEGSYTFLQTATIAKDLNGTWGTSPSETDGGLFGLSKK